MALDVERTKLCNFLLENKAEEAKRILLQHNDLIFSKDDVSRKFLFLLAKIAARLEEMIHHIFDRFNFSFSLGSNNGIIFDELL